MKRTVLILLFMISAVSLALDFSIYPTRFEFDITKMNTEELFIINNTTAPLRIEVFAESDKNFGEEFNLNENIKIFPKMVSVKPAGKQVVRFRVVPKKEDGEFKSYITFKEIPRKKSESEQTSENISSNIGILAELSIPVYGQGKNIDTSGEITKLNHFRRGNSLQLDAAVTSTGNSSIKLSYELVDKATGKKYEGKLGNSTRTGKSQVSTAIYLENKNMSSALLTIRDESGKVYYKKNISL
ncbi:molecular chaperone [Fusobacterium sp.]|uniref:fimbrial biogenesis chaperone n=1 Tax=Fusobacterium sp. TaxID=68766 RepID=UPI00396C524E